MRALQISNWDTVGSRFNNLDLAPELRAEGVESRMLAWRTRAQRPDVRRLLPAIPFRAFNRLAVRLDRLRSAQARLGLHTHLLAADRWFREAEVVHYHILHDEWFSLDALPRLTRLRPSVWTWHDPWPMTGHCIYPAPGCERWREGCGACPDLALPLPMRSDRTAAQHAWKHALLPRIDADIVVASRVMEEMARASPIARGARLHRIPFGVDLTHFAPGGRAAARRRLGIEPGRFVIAYRHTPSNPYKGTGLCVAALRELPRRARRNLTILTTQDAGAAHALGPEFDVREMGWIKEAEAMLDSYRATDLFLMPSSAEAFGMMALEAMACGIPAIVADGTSLPELVDAPRCGLSVPQGDAAAIAAHIFHLMRHPAELAARGRAARALAEARHDSRRFAADLAALYREAAARRARG